MDMTRTFSPAISMGHRDNWDAVTAAFEAARIISDDYHERVLDPMFEELDRIAPRPDLHFEIVATSGQVGRFFVPPNDLHVWDNHISPTLRRKAAEVREAWLTHVAAREQLGYDAICEESERLCRVQCDAEKEAIFTPSPHLAALLWKLDRMFGPEACADEGSAPAWCMEWVNALMADAHRLLGSPASRSIAA